MEEALTAHLLAWPALAALVGDRIGWKTREQGSPLPAVVLHLVSGRPDQTMKGRSGLSRGRVQADCLAESYTVALAVERAVAGATEALPRPAFGGSFVENQRDTLTDTETDPIVGRSLDLMVWHRAG
jgi:hypothetical protein